MVDSFRNNSGVSRDLQSPPLNSTLLEKESMVANFGDSKMVNSFSEASFPSITSESCTPGANAEDSGIDDRSRSLEKVRVEIGEEGQVKPEGPVAVSSPAEASTPITECPGEEKKLLSSLLSDQNENELCYKENENNNKETKEESAEISKEEGINNEVYEVWWLVTQKIKLNTCGWNKTS